MTAPLLSTLLGGAGVRPISDPGADPEILGVALDSRTVPVGSIFFAIRGLRIDGNAFVPDALAHGARAILSASPRPPGFGPEVGWVQVEEPRRAAALLAREWHGRPDEAMTLVGITGTNGKTTVAYLVEAMAAAAGRRTGRMGTVGISWGGREQPTERTTLESTELYALLATMRDAGTEFVALEVSSHGLALGRVEGARFTVAAFLNLGRDHLDYHGTLEEYFEAKALLFDRLGPEATAVLPADGAEGGILAARTRARVSTFGRSELASVRIRNEHCANGGSSALLDTSAGTISIETALLGRFNLDNIAAAAACALATGVPPEAVAAGARSLRVVPGRVEPVDQGQPFTVFVDYAHTEEALSRMLGAVRELTSGRILAVFGCGGERDPGKRPQMGQAASRAADLVFLTSDNPRGEDPLAILGEIEAGVATVPGGVDRCRIIPDRTEAIGAAIGAARPGDAVAIVGKGHETTQTFRDRVEPFDDREVARKTLSRLGWNRGDHADA